MESITSSDQPIRNKLSEELIALIANAIVNFALLSENSEDVLTTEEI